MKLTISHLSKQYRADFWGLRDFDLELAPGGIGYLPQNFGIYLNLSGMEFLEKIATI